MKFPKILIPFLAVVLPTIRFSTNDTEYKVSQKNTQNNGKEITSDESADHSIVLRQFSDSERFLQFVKHSSHSSHRSHSSHSSHKSGSHSSHYSSSDCNGCAFEDNAQTEEEVQISSELIVRR